MSTQRRATRTDAPEQTFSGSVLKVDKEGREVLSDTVYPGERLKREVDEEKAAEKATHAKAAAAKRTGARD